MKLTKVIYQFGHNKHFDNYILDSKDNAIEHDINPKSLAFELSGPGKIKVSKYCQMQFGNFDYLLIQMEKETENPRGYFLAFKDEIKII